MKRLSLLPSRAFSVVVGLVSSISDDAKFRSSVSGYRPAHVRDPKAEPVMLGTDAAPLQLASLEQNT